MKVRNIFLITTLFCSLASHSVYAGRVVSYDDLRKQHFGAIQELVTCGDWRSKNKIGKFRVMSVFLYGQDMLFADMVYHPLKGSVLKIERGYTFAETNNDHAETGIEKFECKEAGDQKIQITVTARNGHNNKKYRFRITLDATRKGYQYQLIK